MLAWASRTQWQAEGNSCAGRLRSRVRVLYIDGEMPAEVVQERLAGIVAGGKKDPEPDAALRFLAADLYDGALPDLKLLPRRRSGLKASSASYPTC